MSRLDEEDELGGMGFDEHQTIKLKEGQHVSAEREREIQQVMEVVTRPYLRSCVLHIFDGD
jgi:hypothetical protein